MNPEWTLLVKKDHDYVKQGVVKVRTKISLETNIRAMPQPRQNYRSRFTDPKAKRYKNGVK